MISCRSMEWKGRHAPAACQCCRVPVALRSRTDRAASDVKVDVLLVNVGFKRQDRYFPFRPVLVLSCPCGSLVRLSS